MHYSPGDLKDLLKIRYSFLPGSVQYAAPITITMRKPHHRSDDHLPYRPRTIRCGPVLTLLVNDIMGK